ncbi:cyclic nucleotide-binding-like protein [Tuber borchii]|uniref:cAMP-dependent protein kinase regulatory subunit n=1 Tax=Tuber borchii TaxID=42251 RepID=A0A2T7A8C5_TUBBO|nr:cyclic nucleotide-binding-like protein [Tuber borchii]
MSLPEAYLDEINALNREILKSKPTDVLQFCANFFNRRLEAQRVEFLLSVSNNSGFSSSNTFGAMPSSSAYVGGESLFPGSGANLGGPPPSGGRESPFSGTITEEDEDVGQSPTTPSFRPAALGGPSLSNPNLAAPPPPSPGQLLFSPRGRFTFGNDQPPHSGPSHLSPSIHLSPNSASPDFPSNYNMSRRTSVSAESLVPSSSNEEWNPPVYPKTSEQLNRLKTAVSGNFLFMHLDDDQSGQVLSALMEKPIPRKGTRVITQGDVGDFFYVVEKGSFDVYVNSAGSMLPGLDGMGKKVNSIDPGGSFGELALMYNAPRAATIISTTSHNILWALDRVTFRRILMENTFKRRRMYEAFLEEVSILSSLVPYERAKIADALEPFTFHPGDVIIQQGDPGDNFYIIESGEAEVVKHGINEPIKRLTKGDYFGELALLNDAPRAASVRAVTRVKLATLGKDGFQRLLGPVAEIMRRNDPRLAEGVDPLSNVGSPGPSGGFDGGKDVVEEAAGRGRAVEV